MRKLIPAIAIASLVWLQAPTSRAADCMCERVILTEGTCVDEVQPIESVSSLHTVQELGSVQEPTAPPQWCERADDPRCMPAHGSNPSSATLVPMAPLSTLAVQAISPPELNSRLAALVATDGEQAAHERRIDRPPR